MLNGTPPPVAAGGMIGPDGHPVTYQGFPVVFMFIVQPDGAIGFVHGNGPASQILGTVSAWFESFRFTMYRKLLGLEPKIVPAALGLVE